jgi:hypothetical protein
MVEAWEEVLLHGASSLFAYGPQVAQKQGQFQQQDRI